MKAIKLWIAQALCDNHGTITKASKKKPKESHVHIAVVRSSMNGEVNTRARWVECACIPIDDN